MTRMIPATQGDSYTKAVYDNVTKTFLFSNITFLDGYLFFFFYHLNCEESIVLLILVKLVCILSVLQMYNVLLYYIY